MGFISISVSLLGSPKTITIKSYYHGFTTYELEIIFKIRQTLGEIPNNWTWSPPVFPKQLDLKKWQKNDPISFDQIEFARIFEYCQSAHLFKPSSKDIDTLMKQTKSIQETLSLSRPRLNKFLHQIATVRLFKQHRGGFLNEANQTLLRNQ